MLERRLEDLLALLVCVFLAGLDQAWAREQEGDIDELRDPEFYEGFEAAFSRSPDEEAFLEVYDPLTAFNRRIYVFNAYFDEYVMLPVVQGYQFVVPEIAQTGVSNFFANLAEIPVFVSSLLQLKGQKAVTTGARFAFNSTFGLLGVIDVASHVGLEHQDEDLGQAAGYYGIGPGPYLVLPILGPSSLRDTGGLVGDFLISRRANAFGVRAEIEASIPLSILDGIQTRENIPFRYGDLNSPFEYELIRYLYIQSRVLKIEE